MRARVTDKSDKEETGIQVPQPVRTIRVVIPTTKHLHPVVLVWVHQAHMRIIGNNGTVFALHIKIRSGKFFTARQWRACYFGAPHDFFLFP